MSRMATVRIYPGAPGPCNALLSVERLCDLCRRVARRQARQLENHLVQGPAERERRSVVLAHGEAGGPSDEQPPAADLPAEREAAAQPSPRAHRALDR